MKKVSATEAARQFADLLDSVEASGETFVIVRRGRPVARIGPAVSGSGLALKETLENQAPDPDWATELRELRESVDIGTDPWRD